MKKNYKLFLGILIGIVLSVSSVYAAESIIRSKNVSYDNINSKGKYTNVQETIDDLYEKSGLLKTKWIEKDLNGADPVLEVENSTKKLIPVTIDDDGTVHYANLNTSWYDYSEKRWANAIILVDNPKNGGKEKYTYKTGDIINENDIESYFVWIPRYSYKIWNMGEYDSAPRLKDVLTNTNYATSPQNAFNKARIIDIKFGDVKTNPKMSESEAQLDKYYTHPAFTLGDKDLNGIWVGKFETGYNQDGDNGEPFTIDDKWTTSGAEHDTDASNRIIVKPNVYSWRSNTVKKIFMSSFNYDRTLDSHMMKNTEWGAVAYLSHSVYGIGTEVRINNNSDFKTGYSATLSTNQNVDPGIVGNTDELTQSYNTKIGYLASTTGNITGIYGMSGGQEYLAAGIENKPGASNFSEIELANYMNTGYIDKYSSDSSITSYNKRILGDATGELGPFYEYYEKAGSVYHNSWYEDYSRFIDASTEYLWFIRSGSSMQGSAAGIFYFGRHTGAASEIISFRLVLSFIMNKI